MGLFPSLPLCLKAWPLTHLPCVLSAAVCVVIGWHRNTLLFLLHRGKAGASRLGRVQTTDEGRGDARRHLRHNLYLPAQPLSPCKKTEFHCCLAGGASVCGPRSPSEMRYRQFFGPAHTDTKARFPSDVISELSAPLHHPTLYVHQQRDARL